MTEKTLKNFFRQDKYKNILPEIVNDLVKSLNKKNSPDHIGSPIIPSREFLIEIIEFMETLVYPGYFGEQKLDFENLNIYLARQINKLFKLLSSQVSKCLMHECKNIHSKTYRDCVDIGEKESLIFLKKLPGLRKILAGDIQATYNGDPAAKSKEEIIFCYPGIKAITIYRLAHELFLQKVPLLPRMMTEYAHSLTGTDIHPGAKIGKNFFIDHATGIVIGETTEIGNNVRIYQGVTLGALSIPKVIHDEALRYTKRHPTIEDNVIIYANATILGGKTVIGKESIIGGNIWLTHSVPPHSKIILEEQKQKITSLEGQEKVYNF